MQIKQFLYTIVDVDISFHSISATHEKRTHFISKHGDVIGLICIAANWKLYIIAAIYFLYYIELFYNEKLKQLIGNLSRNTIGCERKSNSLS